MGRPRATDLWLPPHVVHRHGAFFWTDPATGRWQRLAPEDDVPRMYRALGDVLAGNTGGCNALFDLYAAKVLPKKATSTRIYQEPQLDVLRAWLGRRDPDSVKPHEIAAFLDDHAHPTTANRIIALLSHIYTFAIRRGLATTNPCRDVERNPEHPRHVYVTDDQLTAAIRDAPKPIALALELAYVTGQRMHDLLTLRWTDVRDEGLYFKQHKTGKELLMAYTPRLDQCLTRCQSFSRGSTHVLLNTRHQPWTRDGFKTSWQKFIRTKPYRFQFRDIRKKSGNDAQGHLHLGNDEKTFQRWYNLKPLEVRGI